MGVGCRPLLPLTVVGEGDRPERAAVPARPEGEAVVLRPLLLLATATNEVFEGEAERAVAILPDGVATFRPLPGEEVLVVATPPPLPLSFPLPGGLMSFRFLWLSPFSPVVGWGDTLRPLPAPAGVPPRLPFCPFPPAVRER